MEKQKIYRLFLFSCALLMAFLGRSQDQLIKPEIESKIDKIISTLSLEEKIGQTCQITLDAILAKDTSGNLATPMRIDDAKMQEAIQEYKIGSILNVSWHTFALEEWEYVNNTIHNPYRTSSTKVPIIYGIDAIHGVNYTIGGTLFPQEIGLSATWNRSLAKSMGAITAYETRASGIHWNFSPVLDIGRQPLWSRHFETLGEDPFLASAMGAELVNGYQGNGCIDSYSVAACLKHFVGYSNPTSGRDRTPAWIPEKYMKELYLPPFKKAVEEGALTLMINSGVVNGVPGHKNYHLLTEVLKEDWGFKGFTVSDWEDFIMLHTVHRTAKDIKDGIVQAFNAGVDMSMVPLSPQYKEYCKLFKEAYEEGLIAPERLDDAVRRILRVKFLVGLFDENFNQAETYTNFGSTGHKSKALQSALESITLLKNDDVLPLSKDSKVLVAGPTSDDLMYLNGAWSHTWQGDKNQFNTEGCLSILEAFRSFNKEEGKVSFAKGAELVLDNGFEKCTLIDSPEYLNKLDEADVVVLCLGEYPSTEKPGDINALDLSDSQLELARIAYEKGKKVVLVLLEGRPRIIRPIVDEAAAIIQAYLPGDYGAEALVKLIYGEENFSGKLPYTYPKYSGRIEFYDRPRSVDRDKQNAFDAFDPQWPFGFGLSYTNFGYDNLQLNNTEFKKEDSIKVSIDVTNNGEIAGFEVVQMYLKDHYASLIPSGKSLKGFEKIYLQPNETKTIQFYLVENDLQFVNQHGEWISEAGEFSIEIGGLEVSFDLKN